MREKCPNTEFFSGPCFSAFGLNTERYCVFSPNAGKYGPEETPYLVTFQAAQYARYSNQADRRYFAWYIKIT